MADEKPPEDKQIEEILTDLDTILSDLGQTETGAAEMAQLQAPPPEASSVIPPPPVAKPAPAPAPPPPPKAAPAVKPVAAPVPAPEPQKIPYAKPQPGAIPVSTPAVPPKPAVTIIPKPVPVAKPAPAPPPLAAPAGLERFPEPAKAADLKIELAPREGTMPAPKKEEPPPPPPKKPAGLPPSHQPLELAPSEPAAPAPAPIAAPPEPISAAASAPVPVAAPLVVVGDEVPEGTPHEYVRRVAAIFLGKFSENIPPFFAFLQQSAQTVSKKPLFARRVLSEVVDEKTDLPALIARVQGVKAVAALAVIEGLPDAKARQLEDSFKKAGLDFRVVAPDDLLKRSVAVDILVEIMLLASEL